MKFGELKSVAHNLADSFASGVGLLIGVYDFQVFQDTASSAEGYMEVDFLTGVTTGAAASKDVAKAAVLYARALPDLCGKHNVHASAFGVLTARFGIDKVYGPHFTVTVEDKDGRRSVDQYRGLPGRRIRRRS